MKYSRFKYTKEKLEEAVANSISIAGVIRVLGLRYSSGRFATIKEKIKFYSINTDHFLGRAANHGKNHKGGQKANWQDILVLKSPLGKREKTLRLRRALIESGRDYKCDLCNKPPYWNNSELRLRVDHISGDWWDSRPENLRFICPDCHSQTETWGKNRGLTDVLTNKRYYHKFREENQGAKNKNKENKEEVKESKSFKCVNCEQNIVCKKNTKCKICSAKSREKIDWPDINTLLLQVEQCSLTQVAKELGVTDNALKKRIRKFFPKWKSNYKPIPPRKKPSGVAQSG